mmetsp:Transcript_6300/g.25158  ORF Transcript_6300/g.25158 Transcript_6300/m.25158 type:complete len:244 (-) Transcript_6300:1882-2613(-)
MAFVVHDANFAVRTVRLKTHDAIEAHRLPRLVPVAILHRPHRGVFNPKFRPSRAHAHATIVHDDPIARRSIQKRPSFRLRRLVRLVRRLFTRHPHERVPLHLPQLQRRLIPIIEHIVPIVTRARERRSKQRPRRVVHHHVPLHQLRPRRPFIRQPEVQRVKHHLRRLVPRRRRPARPDRRAVFVLVPPRRVARRRRRQIPRELALFRRARRPSFLILRPRAHVPSRAARARRRRDPGAVSVDG